MGSLQSIDFSRNQLSGEIPPTISNLSFLSMLDVAYNHLKGKIPTGTQLQTFDASSFIGNNLCGPPLPINCSSNGKTHSYEGSDGHGVNWFFVSATIGFIVGFWIVIAPLLICVFLPKLCAVAEGANARRQMGEIKSSGMVAAGPVHSLQFLHNLLMM
ncbi:receptor-like protein EIX2 [Glycine max]|uniref:receptor-like protein EIX2 n=1 Tax=Glycine max TaxID=3847 RepID=UPI0003DEA286|nr:receptor-like protein EIX2 [Glycine max]|eukprot:XP_025981920.1 receptor-like protein EIX2 [Glycine max]